MDIDDVFIEIYEYFVTIMYVQRFLRHIVEGF